MGHHAPLVGHHALHSCVSWSCFRKLLRHHMSGMTPTYSGWPALQNMSLTLCCCTSLSLSRAQVPPPPPQAPSILSKAMSMAFRSTTRMSHPPSAHTANTEQPRSDVQHSMRAAPASFLSLPDIAHASIVSFLPGSAPRQASCFRLRLSSLK